MRILLSIVMAIAAACSGGNGGGSIIVGEPQRLLVLLEEPEADEEVEDLREDFDGVSIERIGGSGIFVLTLPAGTDLDGILHEMDDDLRILVSERDYTAESPEGDPAGQPVFGDEFVAAIGTQPGLVPLALPAAHAQSTGAGAIVAIIDTGVDPAHPALLGHVAPGGFDFIGQDDDPREERNFLDDDADGVADEQYGHGTFVASLVLAVAPDALILPVRALDDEGFGTSSTVAAGIIWAADAGARVINVSADLPDDPEIVREAIRYARDRDAVVVAAAGNGGLMDVGFPASFNEVVGVTAIDGAGRRPPFANVGDGVSVVAPGTALLGALPLDRAPAGTATWSGTSFAAPLVAGTAALIRAAFPVLTRDAVRRRLEDTAQSVEPMNPDLPGLLGNGLVQPAAALE